MHLGGRQMLTPRGRHNLDLVARGQPRQLPRHRRRQQSQSQILAALLRESLQECQPTTDPALVPLEQLRHLRLRKPVLTHQSLDDPCLLQLLHPATNAVESQDDRLGRRLIHHDQPCLKQRHGRKRPARRHPLEAVQHLRPLLPQADRQRRELAIARERARHGRFGRHVRQPIPPVTLANRVQRNPADLPFRPVLHRPATVARAPDIIPLDEIAALFSATLNHNRPACQGPTICGDVLSCATAESGGDSTAPVSAAVPTVSRVGSLAVKPCGTSKSKTADAASVARE